MSRCRFLAIAMTVAITMWSSPAFAADEFSFPTHTIIRGEPGTLVELGRVVVNTDLAGPLCTWSATATNQESAHPGNDILIRSGTSELLLSGVEDAAGKVTTNSGSAYLATEVLALLRLGPDGVFSGGLHLTISYESCVAELPSTTLPATTIPTSAVPETTVLPTTLLTTTEPTTTAAPVVDSASPSTASTSVTIAPLGPSVLPSSTAAPTTSIASSTVVETTVAEEAQTPILPVTGSTRLQTIALVGLALIAMGAVLSARGHIGPNERSV